MKKVLIGLFLAGLAACSTEGFSDDAVGTVSAEINVSKGFFLARQDFRKCAFPMCGGFFVHQLNNASMTCADGSVKAECYVAKANLSSLGFKAAEQQSFLSQLGQGLLVVKGNLSDSSSVGTWGQLNASAVYEAWTDQPATGSFHSVYDSGIRCITAPCNSLAQQPLNSDAPAAFLTGFDFSAINMAEETQAQVWEILSLGHLIAAGSIAEKPGVGATFVASQLYARRFPKAIADFAGQWQMKKPAPERDQYNYFLEADGTFTAQHLPGCLFAPKEADRCAVKMALLSGTWALNYDATFLTITYTDSIRNGETASFVVEGAGDARKLKGFDFGAELKLKKQ
jgi:hypothetical protein